MIDSNFSRLESNMRPYRLDDMQEYHSLSGFLGEDEVLEETLKADSQLVKRYNLTHQQLAAPLFEAKKIASEHLRQTAFRETSEEFFRLYWNDQSYWVNYTVSAGRQYSPFQDGTYSSMDLTLVRQSDEKTLTFSGLLPEMIARYGFYEGKQVPYRLDPEDIIEFFHLAPAINLHNRDTQG